MAVSYLKRVKKTRRTVAYHESNAGDGTPGITEGGPGQLEVAEMAGEHNGDKRDGVVGHVGEYHGQGEQHLLLGLLVQNSSPPSHASPLSSTRLQQGRGRHGPRSSSPLPLPSWKWSKR